MKAKHIVASLLILVLSFVLTGCAGKSTMQTINESCTGKNANALVGNGYQKKVDNFLIVQDASSTMGEKPSKASTYDSKLAQSKDLVKCLNTTLPDNFDVKAGLRAFGPYYSEKGRIYGMTDYSKAGLDGAVNSLGDTGGVTPLANTITYAGNDLLNVPGLADIPGPTAMILFSDGLNTDAANPAAAAAAIKEMYGSNICIYTVLIGDSLKGKATMQQIADASKCGFATDANEIGNAQGMDRFVEDVFLVKGMKPTPEPVVKPTPAPVMKKPAEKISMILHFEFDFDKDVVRPSHHDDAKRIADALNKYSDANALLEGHTDSMGDEAYNMSLSRRRAENVKNYVVEKFNIRASRISTDAYGESRPVDTNKTDEGRQRNRRVVANIQ